MQLAEFMQAEKLSDEALAEKLGMTRTSVSRYRRKVEIPSAKTIKKLIELSDGRVTANELLKIESGEAACS